MPFELHTTGRLLELQLPYLEVVIHERLGKLALDFTLGHLQLVGLELELLDLDILCFVLSDGRLELVSL